MVGFNRREFIGGIAGAYLGLNMSGYTNSSPLGVTPQYYSPQLVADLQTLVEQTPFVDTHEHLLPEAERLANKDNREVTPAPDIGLLFSHYSEADLQISGLSKEDYQKLLSWDLTPRQKWKLVAPYYERCRNTGYLLSMREAVKALYGEDDIREDNCERISEEIYKQIQPGYYRRILRDVANIEYVQINCPKGVIFRESEPASDLVCFDLYTFSIGSYLTNAKELEKYAQIEVNTIEQAHQAIERIFERYGPKAIAVKDPTAYRRRIKYESVKTEDIQTTFKRFAQDPNSISSNELKAIQDNLFRKCVECATEYNLPIKFHTGYLAGFNYMDLSWIRDNLCDLVTLIKDFPNTKFILMHISYPYQHELIALCKHYPNVYADMCWSWILDPASATRFLREFLTTAPAHKIFTFGGDYIPVELVPGHAKIARRGIALAMTQLIQEGWISESDAPEFIRRIMNRNAHETFDLPRVLKAYNV